MSFQKGSRFAAEKISNVPGPNIYSLPEDANKRGSLEKTDRFSKEKVSNLNVPGQGSCNPVPRAVQKTFAAKHASDDRYATLLKKLEDLEKVHADGKKAHQIEIERYKFEVARLSKSNLEQGERLDKLKKHNEILESRIQEYKKTNTADQSELKELRVKLRMSEHERTQLVSKLGESSETKKALQSLEARRKDEVRERERKIAELEKAASAERKKSDLLESYVNELKGKTGEEARKSRDMMTTIQGKLDAANKDSQDTRQALTSLRGRAENQESNFAARLDQCRSVLSRVAEEYGRLATTTVAASNHATLVKDHTALQLRSFRLERKLANSEGQVVELANLVRHTQEENTLLCQELRDAREEAAFHLQTLQKNQAAFDSCSYHTELHELLCLEGDIHQDERDISRETMVVQESALVCTRTMSDFYRSHNDELLPEYSRLHGILEKQHEIGRALIDQLGRNSTERDALRAELTKAQIEITTGQRALADAQISLTEGRAEQHMLQRRLEEFENNIRDTAASHKQALRGERDTSQKLSVALHVSKTAEDALKADIEQLQAELADLSRFQEAYYNLVDETEALVARNNLAEEEAENLSKFNAEILGHNNPVQRILYVDRIRRELSEVKQKLLVCTRDRDAISAVNEDLLHEIMMYKSVAIPEDNKPRTNLTRVTRPPLTSQSINIVAVTPIPPCVSSDALIKATVLEHIPGDMTLDELI
ncbi:uncharacterized protein BJ212DRAFT_1449095 [Suillus subaureus]|uniref:Hyaluronan-mediated motility receptor C-terminal domain-containing protein n=1 Tax=Suillus subaureus TaxID=48587 RepID=A0A9P7E0P1_9AGAM|nr:uncharacterized protein BJ212DRAFT_1449095 [Suillus subaureus]KAG1808221.1 hypothetical protein BJ212DRAFT_1449095 [Suillus subaureus]